MYEFHGWAVLRYHTHDTDFEKQEAHLKILLNFIFDIDTEKVVSIKQRNGLDSFLISGLHNHKAEYVLEIFTRIAELMPGSYGLLYIHDNEEFTDEKNNKFIVWKLARGQVIEQEDNYLSPYIPTVEDPYDKDRFD
ncbi:hypothetical protein E5161_17070 [Cohnella pontilimi]|uniref:Immunity protein 7 of polymorphic toxin system n=1 Tax=Cohnella pontilimi TaxID=2564100 RepID=A0A4V5LS59_9BACL|nr:Imm7 family immunity protein [Cohnella pontilimi]TJY40849.1 hypothetical protein E5161_17070 [Cohnella pontilimi]